MFNWTVSFTNPIALWLLLVMPAALLIGALSRRPAGRWRRRLSLGLRAVILTALVLALAGIQLRRSVDDLTVTFLVDVSDSLPAEARATTVDYLRDALGDMPAGDRAAIVVFGKDALAERTASDLRTLDELASVPITTRTDIAEAIQLGLALFPGDTQKRLVLLSDGQPNEGDAREAVALAAARDIPLDVVPLASGVDGPEVLLAGLDAPPNVRQGQRLELTARLESNTATRVRLRIVNNSQSMYDETIDVPTGGTRVAIPITADQSGFRRFRATIEPASGADTLSQNNRAAAFTFVAGPPTILIVTQDTAEVESLMDALTDAGMRTNTIGPDAIPTDLTQLAAYDSVVLANVPASDVLPAAQSALAQFVRDLGHGLVMLGGPESFGAGVWLRTPVEEALPVSMEVRNREREPNVALVMAVDKSGSMGQCHCDDPNNAQAQAQRIESGLPKVDIAKDAILQASFALGEMDFLGVVAFDQAARWALEPQRYPGNAIVEDAIAGIAANGQTNIFAGLDAAEQQLTEVPARVRHIILVTDGWSNAGDYQALAERLRENDITLSVVAAGRGSATGDLSRLATDGGGRFYPAASIGEVPQLFLKETIRVFGHYIIEEPFRPAPAGPSAILRGFDPGALPPLLGYNGTTVKPAATEALVTPRGDPLLAQWRYGLGRSVAWTSDLSGRWGAEMVAWDQFGEFSAQLVNWTVPDPRSETLSADADVQSGVAHIRVTAQDESGQPRNFVPTEAQIIGPDGEVIRVEVPQAGPGEYDAQIPLDEVGAYFATVVQTGEDGEPIDSTQLGLVVPYSPEYRLLETDETLLRELARTTGGRQDVTPDAVFASTAQDVTTARHLWPALLLLAILLFPLDIAARRLAVRPADVRDWVERARSRLTRPRSDEPHEAERALGSLFSAKERAARRQQPAEPTESEQPSTRSSASSTPTPQSDEETDGDDEKDAGDTLSRLRDAKRRGRRDR